MRLTRPAPKTVKHATTGSPKRVAETTTQRVPRVGLEVAAKSSAEQLNPQPPVGPLGSLPLGDSPAPSWVPPGFHLKKAAEGLRAVIESRGGSVDRVGTLLVTDADRTLVETRAMTLLKNHDTGELARDPVTHEPLRLGPEIDLELAALKEKLPQLPWAALELDYSEFADPKDIATAHLIRTTAHAIRASDKDPDARQVVITARQGSPVLNALEGVSLDHGLGLDAIFSANAPQELQAMGLDQVKLGTAERKALMIAALVELYGASRVTFYDDGDENLSRTKELLGSVFPSVHLTAIDVVRARDGRFRQIER